MILDVRGKPIKTMLEGIRTKLMVKFNTNRTKTETANWEICPTYAEMLEEAKYNSRWCQSLMAGPNIYQVSSGDNTYSVNLLHRTCGCRKWDMTAMPCNHAVSAIVKAKLQPEDFVDDFFKKAIYQKAYGHIIFPVPGPNLLPRTRTQDIEPPVFRDKVGKQQTKRRKKQFEKPAPRDTSRMASITYSNCKLVGHRYTVCSKPLKPALAMRQNQHQPNRSHASASSTAAAPTRKRPSPCTADVGTAPPGKKATPAATTDTAPPRKKAAPATTAPTAPPRRSPSKNATPAPTAPPRRSPMKKTTPAGTSSTSAAGHRGTFHAPRQTGRKRTVSYKMKEFLYASGN
ncbi:hypothetical protein ACQJBY_008661 [Aegilops geniculata]